LSEADRGRRRRFDRQFWLAVVVAAAVVIPRTALVSLAHSECFDDQYHLSMGLSFLLHTDTGQLRNDPPLGEGLIALPMIVTGCIAERPEARRARMSTAPAPAPSRVAPPYVAVLYDQPLRPETILLLVAIWKAVLFVPGAALIFHWCRRVYGSRSAWLALALVLAEPTIAGHIVPAALDVLAAEAILLAAYLAWRYFETPTRGRMVAAGMAMAAALLTKHTAVLLPAVIVAYAVAWRVIRAHVASDRPPDRWRRAVNELFGGALITVAALWALTLFDVSPPARHGPLIRTQYTEQFSFGADVVNGSLMRRWPAGIYIGSIRTAQDHARLGHTAYALGRTSQRGWWWYYLVTAWFKVPLGIAIVILLGVSSVVRVRPRWDELALLLLAVGYGVFLSMQPINIGFRHFLPAYVPVLMLASRCLANSTSRPGRGWSLAAWAGVGLAALHVLSYHPDYLSYFNWPRRNNHRALSDSNIDWGQSLKQARVWLDQHPAIVGRRDVYLAYFDNLEHRSVEHYLGPRVREIDQEVDTPLPHGGLLIVSPVHETGQYDPSDRFGWLRRAEQQGAPGAYPIAIIGHCLRVYDLEQLARGGVAPH
jgi:hypothetical protein